MRRKFVQIAALILALSLLPTSFAAAEQDNYQSVQDTSMETGFTAENSEIDVSGEDTSDSEQDITEPDEEATAPEQDTTEPDGEEIGPAHSTTEPDGGENDPNQSTTEADGGETDSDQGTTEPDGDETDPDQGTTEPDGGETDPDQGTTEPDGGETDPDQGTTEPDGGETDPDQGTTEPDGGETDPDQGTTEPDGGETDPDQGTTEPDGGETDPNQGATEPDVPEVIVPILDTEEETERILRVGMNYGTSALTSANLLNSIGSGYRFGFHVGSIFYQVGSTNQKSISVLKTQNLYYTPVMSDGYSGYAPTETSGPAVGCIHLQLPGTYATFAEASAAADSIGGFPAWINSEFVVRYGVFLTGDAARQVQADKNWTEAAVVGTSEYGLTVVKTGTNSPIFQYDGGADYPMFVVKPGLDNSVKTVTHYKGIKYYGSFRYERINGGDISVVNLVNMDDYVRGVIPYEMSPSWPLEALKAQAVSARSYAVASTNASHQRNHFDVCTSTCCQVYYGTGGATAITDQAVDETAGLYAWYGDKIILAVFHSSDGGATENCENVWNEALPYLRGVVDPFEALAADKNPYHNWSKTFTGKQLQEILNSLGYGCSPIVSVKVNPSETGNVQSLTFLDTDGKSWTISKYKNVKTNLGLKSMRYTVSSGNNYVLSNEQTIGSLNGTWVMDGNGNLVQVNASPVYAITANGVEEVPGSNISDAKFVFNGSGNGHNLGMSQWGAYAMAKEGFTYDKILKFYFTGIEIHE